MSIKKRGRPSKLDELTVKKLEDSFKYWLTVKEACSCAGISRETFYRKFNSDSEFRDKMEYFQNFPFIFAKSKIFEAMNSKDLALAAKYALEFLKRRDPERKDKADNNISPVWFSSIVIKDATTYKSE